MTALTIRNSRGLVVDVESISATAAKNAFGAVLEKAASYGIVAITKRDKARAVVLSIEEFEALMARVPDPLASIIVTRALVQLGDALTPAHASPITEPGAVPMPRLRLNDSDDNNSNRRRAKA